MGHTFEPLSGDILAAAVDVLTQSWGGVFWKPFMKTPFEWRFDTEG
jgi:hypothetical protein